MDSAAIVLAAGRGERMGGDKALLELGGETAVERVVRTLRAAGCDDVVVVRRSGAAALPSGLGVRIVDVESDEMIVSLRAGLARCRAARLVVFQVDQAMVGAATLRALLAALDPAAGLEIALPLCRQRPGHPLVLGPAAQAEAADPDRAATLRDVIRRDRQRVATVPVTDGWTLRDLDEPAELHAARGALHNAVPAPELMARHRSRRRYRPEPVGDRQLRWLIDSARHAPTSSYGQSYAAVVVRDPERKRRVAALCADQRHIHEAPVFVAVCADLHKIGAACARHGGALDTDPLEVFVQATVDAALFGQNLQLAAESEGLGSCMIGAARNHPVELAELLGLPPAVYVVFGMTLGWPADDPVPRGRMTLDAVLHTEVYDAAGTERWLDDADAVMRAWARQVNARRGADAPGRPVDEARGWTDRMWWLWGRGEPPKGRESLCADLRRLGFGLESGSARRDS